MSKTNIPELLIQLRNRAGKSQREVAEGTFINLLSYNRIERGKQDIKLKYLEQVANYYGLNLSELFEMTEPEETRKSYLMERLKAENATYRITIQQAMNQKP